MRILVLGDGNFSFGKSLEQRLESSRINYDYLNITSYDPIDDLLLKYPESKFIVQHLSLNPKVQLNYTVDATKSLTYLTTIDRFDFVIFNFPHIGVENSQIHSSMIGHMLHQIMEIMKENGIFYLTLADDQSVNWKLNEMCQRNNYLIHHTIPFKPQDWSGYDMRRHQIGKSFHQRTQRFTTFALVTNLSSDKEISNGLFEQLLFHQQTTSSLSPSPSPSLGSLSSSLVDEPRPNEVNQNYGDNETTKTKLTTMTTTTAAVIKKSSSINTKKRKVVELTQHRYTLLPSDHVTHPSQYQCLDCQKIFLLEQGVKTHVYMTHILNPINSNHDKSVVSLQCSICNSERIFPNEEALFQHQQSRHSTFTPPPPPVPPSSTSSPPPPQLDSQLTTEKGPSSPPPMTERRRCPICGLDLVSSLEEHLQQIIPTKPPSLQCEKCHKRFHSERSLQQHLNFCSLKIPPKDGEKGLLREEKEEEWRGGEVGERREETREIENKNN